MMKKIFAYFPLLLIVVIGIILRFYNLDWDHGFYLHPDERLFVNASNLGLPHSWSEFFSPTSPLNPHMFYYGSFLLYLYKVASIVSMPYGINFLFVSRGISAFFSVISIIGIYFLGEELFNKKVGFISAFIFTFSVGSIQYAHFNTTESFLVFLSIVICYTSLIAIKKHSLRFFALTGILLGISYATKITGLVFGIFPAISLAILFFQKTSKIRLIYITTIFLTATIIAGVVFAPYQIIDYQQFHNEQSYMQSVTYGLNKPPFVIIYEGTIAYIYPLLRVLPFTFGFLSLPLALFGFGIMIKEIHAKKRIQYGFLYTALFPILYFIWAGLWYAKFERYYILLFPFFALIVGYFLQRFSRHFIGIVLLFIMINGFLWMKVYIDPHPRIQASEWIYQHVSSGAILTSEYWDDSLPLPIQNPPEKEFIPMQLSLYDTDTGYKIDALSQKLARADYVILSSRRVYASLLQNAEQYPYTVSYYKLLFEGRLGYTKVKSFQNYPFFVSDDIADESFQSYDHPPVVIFHNSHTLNQSQISEEIISNINSKR